MCGENFKKSIERNPLEHLNPKTAHEDVYGLWKKARPGGSPRSPEEEARLLEDERQSTITSATDTVNAQFEKFDDPFYAGLAKKYSDFQLPLVQEQKARALRDLELGAPTRRSSAYAETLGELERDVGRAEIDVNSGALDYANQARQRTEDRRGTLLTQVQAGMGSEAAAGAAAQQAAALSQPPQISPVADLFQRYSSIYANNQLAQNAGYPGFFGQRGTTTPSRGGSVKDIK